METTKTLFRIDFYNGKILCNLNKKQKSKHYEKV